MEKIEKKRKVGRPKGSKNKVGVKTGRPKLENKRDIIRDFKLRINKSENELFEKSFNKMGLNENTVGNKKKFIMTLIDFYLNN